MGISDYIDATSPRQTPQSEVIPGREADMARNAAGGFAFVLDDWARLDRFLVLGSDAPTYYATARKLTQDNAACVRRCIVADGLRAVRAIVAVSDAGRAPKNDPAIFALAMAAKLGDDTTRKAAYDALSKVCRIPTHLFAFVEAAEAFGGWGRGMRRAIRRWYTDRDPSRLAYQMVKYQQRGGWSHRDLLRLSKPKGHGPGTPHGDLFAWATKGTLADSEVMELPSALAEAAAAEDERAIVRLVADHGLPRECIPTRWLKSPAVWEALLDNRGRGMPMTALVRGLAQMTACGLVAPMSDAAAKTAALLHDEDRIKASRLHPLNLLVAHRIYARGRGEKGSLSWSPVSSIVDALDFAFYSAFGNVESAGKRTLLALDVSGSMTASIGGLPLSCREASVAMAMVTAAAEPAHRVVGFTSAGSFWLNGNTVLTALDVSPRRRLDDNVAAVSRLPFGGTDCALPMVVAQKSGWEIDTFVVYTDNETWAGKIHPAQALKQYRKATGIPAKLIVVGMTSTGFSIADPKDGGMLDVVGFDTAAPAVMTGFSRG